MQARSRRVIVGVITCLLTLYVVRVYLTISTDYRLTVDSAEKQVATLSSALEQHASRTMGEAEGILTAVSQLVTQNRMSVSGHATEQIFHDYAAQVLRKSPQIKSVFLVSPEGTVFATSGPLRFSSINARDREYYLYHKTHRETESHVSAPVQSRIDGSWLFTITRRMEAADGSLKMIAGVALEPSYFNRFYQQLDTPGHGGRFALLRNDGAVLINFPVAPASGSRHARVEEVSEGIFPLKAPHAVLHTDAEQDGLGELVAYRKSQIYPLVSVVCLPMREILEPWQIRAFWHGTGAATSILLISLLTFSLVGRLKHLDQANSALVAQQQELELAAHVFEQSQQSIIITDPTGIILRVNQYFTELTGYLPEEVVGLTPRVLKSQRHDEAFYRDFWKCLTEQGKWKGEIWNRRKNGDGFAALLSICSVRDDAGQISHYIGMIEDITEQKLSSERIYHLAHFDVLTNLPNRRLFHDRLLLTLRHAERYQNRFAIMFLDLDNFKQVNDSLGHHAGDLLLQEVARRLVETLRKIDTVARFGGDEFAVLMEDVKEPADVKRVAEKLIAAVSTPLELEGSVVQVGVSVGVSMYPTDGITLDSLLHNADSAMYRAKAGGKNRCHFFNAATAAQAGEGCNQFPGTGLAGPVPEEHGARLLDAPERAYLPEASAAPATLPL